MKKICNNKSKTDFGWYYRMIRVIDGQQYAIDLVIPYLEIPHRDVVAWRIRRARAKLQRFILQKSQNYLDSSKT